MSRRKHGSALRTREEATEEVEGGICQGAALALPSLGTISLLPRAGSQANLTRFWFVASIMAAWSQGNIYRGETLSTQSQTPRFKSQIYFITAHQPRPPGAHLRPHIVRCISLLQRARAHVMGNCRAPQKRAFKMGHLRSLGAGVHYSTVLVRVGELAGCWNRQKS